MNKSKPIGFETVEEMGKRIQKQMTVDAVTGVRAGHTLKEVAVHPEDEWDAQTVFGTICPIVVSDTILPGNWKISYES